MSHGDDVLDNWEEIDETGLSMTLQTKLQTSTSTVEEKPLGKMKLLQRPQSIQESSTFTSAPSPKQITIARKPQTEDATSPPVLMVLHKSSSEYESATYATPISNQTVKILRRPAQAEERRDTNGLRPKQPIKTLKQREQEYAEARLRILGAAKNPEDDKPAAAVPPAGSSSAPPSAAAPVAAQATPPPAASNHITNNNNNNINSNPQSNSGPGMHRSSSAPKMSQTSSSPMYNNYNSYFQGPGHNTGLNYFYQQTGPPAAQPQTASPLQQHQHFNQRMPPYGAPNQPPAPSPQATSNPQQSWSPVVGGSVSAALLRQQSLQTPQQQQQQQQLNPYNDNVLRMPRGPCPNGSIGFQMRR